MRNGFEDRPTVQCVTETYSGRWLAVGRQSSYNLFYRDKT